MFCMRISKRISQIWANLLTHSWIISLSMRINGKWDRSTIKREDSFVTFSCNCYSVFMLISTTQIGSIIHSRSFYKKSYLSMRCTSFYTLEIYYLMAHNCKLKRVGIKSITLLSMSMSWRQSTRFFRDWVRMRYLCFWKN